MDKSKSKLRAWLGKADWENWINLFLGVWVLTLPWTVGYGFHPFNVNVVSWNFVIMGIVVAGMSVMAIRKVSPYAEWLNLFAGVWLFLSPWFLLYEDNSPWYVFYNENNLLMWNSIVLGTFITLFSALTIPIVEKIVYKKHRKEKNKDDYPLFYGKYNHR